MFSATTRVSSIQSLLLFSTITLLINPSDSSMNTFIFGGCSQQKYTPGSPYESNVNSLLTSLVNSAMFSSYNNFTSLGLGSNSQDNVVYGLFQCRGDLRKEDCASCVANSVSQLGILCFNARGGALQVEGCFIKYDNTRFLGVTDKTVVMKKCGPSIGYDSDKLTRRDAILDYLATSGGSQGNFRVGGSGNIQGLAQCVGDLSAADCQDCLADTIGRLKTECGPAGWGDMFLAKCYVRYSGGGDHSRSSNEHARSNDDEIEKTLAIIVGLVAGVSVVIVFLSFLNKFCEKRKGIDGFEDLFKNLDWESSTKDMDQPLHMLSWELKREALEEEICLPWN